MALLDAVVVVDQLTFDAVQNVPTQQITLRVSFQLRPMNGSVGINETVIVQQPIAATANQWRTAILNAIKAFAAAPVGSPDTYTLLRLVGFVDITTVVP